MPQWITISLLAKSRMPIAYWVVQKAAIIVFDCHVVKFLHFSTANRHQCRMYVSFGQGSSLLWTHTLRPFYSRPIALTQEGRSQVADVCEYVRD